MDGYTAKITSVFGERVRFIGIQGSQARGEANENSDIDVVLLLDRLDYADIKAYDLAVSD
ncbi:MAG: nucleotidyltransferase domain-containing protein, partial [Clostridia bacterium]|nr:nucleotidyltransferase domain-containing protein [Clostridia bacterium]